MTDVSATPRARYGVAIFHGIGDVLNCTPMARQLKTDDPACHITWYSSQRHGFVLDNNPDIDELVLLPGDPFELDGRMAELEGAREWTRFFTPAPYLNYGANPGASLHELIRSATGLDYTVPFWSVLRLREEEIRAAREYWDGLPHGPRILVETEFHSDQSYWNDLCAFDLLEILKEIDPLLVFSGRNPPPFLDELARRGGRVAFCPLPLRENAELYNLADAFIGVSSGLSCLSLSTHCRRDLPSIEYCRGEHWSTAHWDHPQERTYAYSYGRFLGALRALSAKLSGRPLQPDFGPTFSPLRALPDGRELIPCPGCNSDRVERVRGEEIVRCRSCGLVYLGARKPLWDAQAVGGRSYGAAPAVRTPGGLREAESDPDCLAAGRPDHLAWLLERTGADPRGLRVLDIGCGWGAWLLGCRSKGMVTTGFELSLADGGFAKETLGLDVRQEPFPEGDVPEASQDLVTFFHSLDPVADPVAFLQKAAHVLVPGGWLYVVVPNFDSFASCVLGDEWPWAEPERHQTQFTRKTLLDLVFQAGFQVEAVSTATGDFGRGGIIEILRAQTPASSEEALNLAVDGMEARGMGEEIRLLARKRGGFKGSPRLPEGSAAEAGRAICPVDDRTPLGMCLKELFGSTAPRRILHVGARGVNGSRVLLASLVRRHRMPAGGFVCVEEAAPGEDPDTRALERAGLMPWVDLWLSGATLAARAPRKGKRGEAWPDDLLRKALRRIAFRPDLVCLSGPPDSWGAQLRLLAGQIEAPCQLILEGPKGEVGPLRNALQGDARFEGWVEGNGFTQVRLNPGAVEPKPVVERILWVRTDAIGDAVLSSSMLPRVAEAYPGAEITVLCQEHIAPLYEACPHVKSCLTFSRTELAKGPEELERLVNRVGAVAADLCLCSVYSREPLTDLMVSASGAWMKVGINGDAVNMQGWKKCANNHVFTKLVPPLPDGNEMDRHEHFLRNLGIEAGGLEPMVWTSPEDEAFAENWLKERGLDGGRAVALFAGAQSAYRVYPRYGEALGAALPGEAWAVLLLGTQGERWVNQAAVKGFGGTVHDLCGSLTLAQSAALIRRCALAVGAESGLAHIACAVGTPNVIVLGGGHFGRFMPHSPLTSSAVHPLSCFLCDWRCPHSRAHCVQDLHPAVLAEAIRQTLQGPSSRPRLFVQSGGEAPGDGPARIDLRPALNAGEVELVEVDTDLPESSGGGEPTGPLLTVFCGVWHKDPNRFELLKGHQACLDAQTVPVERVYVFDGGDAPPAWLKGKIVTAREPLGLYEAWNVALSLVRTPYVMNLNLDDRLNPDAAALYEKVLEGGADLVGGDWRICFSQEETDAVAPSTESSAVPFYPDWPPVPGRPVRLGSGTGDRGTLGPACAWRMALHAEIPRYPWQFKDGSPIRIIGDSVWWRLLLERGKAVKRLPILVGRYHSHPGEQAEFRNPAAGEEETLARIGLPPL